MSEKVRKAIYNFITKNQIRFKSKTCDISVIAS